MIRQKAGFSLMEVMVALVIITIVAKAVLFFSTNQIASTARLELRSLATIVAQNTLVELRLKQEPIFSGTISVVTLAGRDFPVEVRYNDTVRAEGLRALDVIVYEPKTNQSRFTETSNNTLVTLTTFMIEGQDVL
jgi:type II secretion system protein I